MMRYDELEQAATKLGFEHGHDEGAKSITPGITRESARYILEGYRDGDPNVLGIQPIPLDNEWAGLRSGEDVLEMLDLRDSDDPRWRDRLLAAYEKAFDDGFWQAVIRAAQAAAHRKRPTLIPTDDKSDEELAREVLELVLAWNDANPEDAES